MAEIALKKKVSLRKKGEQADFTFENRLRVKLLWTTDTDLDLCLFFKRKDGEVGGIFSNEYRNKMSDLGNLEAFPYMLHKGDEGQEGDRVEGKEEEEQIHVVRLDDIDTAYVCIVNYEAAQEGRDVTYAQEGGRVVVRSDSGDNLEVIADSTDPGQVYLVCSIKNENGKNSLKREDTVMDLSSAFSKIPGFALICE